MHGNHIRVSLVFTNSTISAVKSDTQRKELNQVIDESSSSGRVRSEINRTRRFDTIEVDGEGGSVKSTVDNNKKISKSLNGWDK